MNLRNVRGQGVVAEKCERRVLTPRIARVSRVSYMENG